VYAGNVRQILDYVARGEVDAGSCTVPMPCRGGRMSRSSLRLPQAVIRRSYTYRHAEGCQERDRGTGPYLLPGISDSQWHFPAVRIFRSCPLVTSAALAGSVTV